MADKRKAIGARIKQYRIQKGYTQAALAEMVGISNNHLSTIERGLSFPNLDTMIAMINALDCSADEIFCDVIQRSAQVQSTRISELVDKLPEAERKKAIAILEVFLQNQL